MADASSPPLYSRSAQAPIAREPGPFRGWRVIAATFTAQLVANGCTLMPFGAFVIPLAEAFGTSRGALSSGYGLGLTLMTLIGPVVGRAVDRGRARALMLSGVIVMSASLLLLSRVSSLWQATAMFLVAAIGAAMFGHIPSTAIAASWFVRRRGLALGVTVAGATVASSAAPAIAVLLIDRLGWRDAIAALAIGGLALALPIFWIFATGRPEDVGQTPDGEPADAEASPEPAASPETREILRDGNFWLIAIAFAFIFVSPIVMGLHLIPYAEDRGIARQDAAYFFSVVAAFSLLGKLAFGAVGDRIDVRYALWLAIGLLLATWSVLLIEPSYELLMFTGVLFGLGVGATAPMYGVVIATCFGRAAFGRVMGIGGLVALPIIAGSAPAVGYLFDATGSYRIGFGLELMVLLLAALMFAFLRLPDAQGRPVDDPRRSPSPVR